MSLRDELRSAIPAESAILHIDRDANLNGLDAVQIIVSVPGSLTGDLICTFARKNELSDKAIAELVARKLRTL
jgi:hypothetical protein